MVLASACYEYGGRVNVRVLCIFEFLREVRPFWDDCCVGVFVTYEEGRMLRVVPG